MKTRPLLFAVLLSALALVGLASLGKDASSNVGSTVPKLTLSYVSNQVDVQGKPYILEFWATWCPPCRQSIPHLNELYAKYKAKGLVIVGVSNEDAATVKAFMKKLPMNYTVALDPSGALGNQFNVRGIPHALVVDKSGKIVWEGHPMAMEESVIEAVLK